MEAPGAPATLDKLKADLKVDVDKLKALKAPDQMGGKAQTDWGKLAKLVAAAEDVLSDLSPAAEKPDTPPVLTLYEIVMKDGATTLKEVPLPASLDK
jgi:hypothetical protein